MRRQVQGRVKTSKEFRILKKEEKVPNADETFGITCPVWGP